MFRLKFKRIPGHVKNMHQILDARNFVDASQFDTIMDEYAETYARFGWTARVRNGRNGGAYLRASTSTARSYYQVKDPTGLWKLPPRSERPPSFQAGGCRPGTCNLPERYRDLPIYARQPQRRPPPPRGGHRRGAHRPWADGAPPAPAAGAVASPGAGSPDLSDMDQAALAALLQTLAKTS